MNEIDYKKNRKTVLIRVNEDINKMLVILSKEYNTSEASVIAIALAKEFNRLNNKGENNE